MFGRSDGDDSGRKSDQKRDEQRPERKLSGNRKRLADQFVHGPVRVLEGGAEIALQQAAEIIEVLPIHGFVHAVIGFEILADFGRDIFLRVERPAGRQADHEKSDRRDDQEHRDHLQDAARDETEHADSLP